MEMKVVAPFAGRVRAVSCAPGTWSSAAASWSRSIRSLTRAQVPRIGDREPPWRRPPRQDGPAARTIGMSTIRPSRANTPVPFPAVVRARRSGGGLFDSCGRGSASPGSARPVRMDGQLAGVSEGDALGVSQPAPAYPSDRQKGCRSPEGVARPRGSPRGSARTRPRRLRASARPPCRRTGPPLRTAGRPAADRSRRSTARLTIRAPTR